jgi:twitching motility two-component system response regulator PilH
MARILIVDDSETQVASMIQALKKEGHEVMMVTDGESGVKYAKQQKPDLVLMDIVMPGLNGFQATRQITHDPQTSHIPVVLITTKSQETDRVWGTRQGAKAYLVKPVPDDLLVETVNEYLPKQQH